MDQRQRSGIVNPMDYPRPRASLKARSRRSAPPAHLYQLKITLEHTDPVIWRRIVVRGDIKLDLLHAVLQIAMGWTNSHLHMFLIGVDRYSDPTLVDDLDWEDSEDEDERKVTLAKVVASGVNTFGYEYDFGDSWGHVLAVEKELPPEQGAQVFARCVDGARACPPEDCGGTGGFADLLKIIRSPRHKEHKSMMAWLGGRFDPAAFDMEETNRFLGMLKWPRTSVTHLGKAIEARLARAGG